MEHWKKCQANGDVSPPYQPKFSIDGKKPFSVETPINAHVFDCFRQNGDMFFEVAYSAHNSVSPSAAILSLDEIKSSYKHLLIEFLQKET
jgi:hypothetical protein